MMIKRFCVFPINAFVSKTLMKYMLKLAVTI